MSWSVTFIGHPENIVKALQQKSEELDGYSKAEYDLALPHLIGLVKQNFNKIIEPVIKITASGHGYGTDFEPQYNTCQVSIENLNGSLV
jgi:hypothetical protein